MKDNDFQTNICIQRKLTFPPMDKPWEIDILKIIDDVPNDRTIHWFYSVCGGIGKTTFMKYLITQKNAIPLPNKTNDACHFIAKKMENDDPINICIFDFPRTSLDHINYGIIEKIKDGMIISGKYEGAECIFACPHVICFANEPPNTQTMSEDRWDIKRIR